MTDIYQVNITTPGAEGSHWRGKQAEANADAVALKQQGYAGNVEKITLADQTLKDRLSAIFNHNEEEYLGDRTTLKEFTPSKAAAAALALTLNADSDGGDHAAHVESHEVEQAPPDTE